MQQKYSVIFPGWDLHYYLEEEEEVVKVPGKFTEPSSETETQSPSV